MNNKTLIGTMSNFLPKDICQSLILHGKNSLRTMDTLGGSHSGRVADGTWLPNSLEEVKFIKNAIAEVSEYPIGHQEELHIVRYTEGGKYDPHYDFFIPGESYYSDVMSQGGQRVESWLIYLNDDFEGGQTHFPKEKITIEPMEGLLAAWRNILGIGTLNWDSQHAGLPVTKGEKWIGVIWVRQFPFNGDKMNDIFDIDWK